MSASTAIAAVYNRLKAVEGVGPNVYDQIRFANDDAQFNALFMDATTNPDASFVHTWMVSREATPANDKVMQAMSRTHTIVMTGFRSCQDGITEPLWQTEVDAIAAVFLPYSTRRFDGAFEFSGPPQVEGVKLVFFRNVLCHTARIVHPVEEFPLN